MISRDIVCGLGLVALCACPSGASEPDAVVTPEPAAASTPPAAIDPEPSPTPSEPGGPSDASPSCTPTVTEVLFLPDDRGVSVTIIGDGFCRGAGVPRVRFGTSSLERVVIDSGGSNIAGRLPTLPISGAALEIHTPPGPATVTDYVVP